MKTNIIRKQDSLKVYDPFSDSCKFLVGDLDLHFTNEKLDAVDIVSLRSEDGVEVSDYMKADYMAKLEDDYLSENK